MMTLHDGVWRGPFTVLIGANGNGVVRMRETPGWSPVRWWRVETCDGGCRTTDPMPVSTSVVKALMAGATR